MLLCQQLAEVLVTHRLIPTDRESDEIGVKLRSNIQFRQCLFSADTLQLLTIKKFDSMYANLALHSDDGVVDLVLALGHDRECRSPFSRADAENREKDLREAVRTKRFS